MTSEKYWDERALKRLNDVEIQSDEHIKRIKKIYARANRDIKKQIANIYKNYSKETGLDIQTLKTLLSKRETDKFWKSLEGKGLKQYVLDNYKARINRLEQLQGQLYARAKEVYGDELSNVYGHYRAVINESYNKTIYDTQIGTGYDFSFNKLDDKTINAVLNAKWHGGNYSTRIWGNTNILADRLSEILGGALISGQSMSKTIMEVQKAFDVGKYYAERLVRTETNHFNAEAEALAYEELGVERYVFVATLDNRTSEKCQNHDGKVYSFKDKKTGVNYPPLHPNCRSTTRGYLGEEEEKMLKRRAKNPITGETEIIDNISYNEWKKKYTDVDSIEKADYSNLISQNHTVVNGKNIVGQFSIADNERFDDGGINRIMELQGYKGKPKIVSDEEFEKLCKESNFFAQRTYGGKTNAEVYDFQRQLYDSNWYIDCSVGGSQYGKGMYCASVYDLNDSKGIKGITEEMNHYIQLARMRRNNYSIVEDITLDKSAKIIKYNDVIPEYMKNVGKIDKWDKEEMLLYDNYYDIINKQNEAYRSYVVNMRNSTYSSQAFSDYNKYKEEAKTLKNKFTNKMRKSHENMKDKDISTLAIEMGYDVINAEGHGKSGSYTVILNRTKLIIRSGGYYYGK